MPETPDLAADHTITYLLEKLAGGEDNALDQLFPMVYDELRRIASGQRHRGPDSTLNTTALLHEAYLRFARGDQHFYQHREHFYAVAAKAMRQILLDEAKHRLRLKRGAGARPTSLDPEQAKIDRQAEMMIALDQGLSRLGEIQDRVRKVVEYRFFGGLTEEEIARVLGVDARTIRRDWAKARAWLAVELGPA